jgi:hypothetical protein
MLLTTTELNKINSVLERFPDVTWFTLEESENTGIGSTLSLEFTTTINYTEGQFSVEISGPDTW